MAINKTKIKRISKNTESDKNNRENKIKKSRNIWKILAIVFVALFIIIIITGLLRAHKFREPPQQLAQEQATTITNIALNDMANREIIIENHTIKTQGVVREIRTNNMIRNVTEVSIYNSTERNMYIIDINSGEIIVYSKTEFFDGLDHLNDDRRINENGDRNMPPIPGERNIPRK
jgi:hypothetical protein